MLINKQIDRGVLQVFNDIRGDVTSGSDSLLQVMQKREFKPYIQPIVRASNRKIIGGELLVHWHTSDRGVIYPDSFIDNMGKAGILSELTCSIINEVVVNFDGEDKFNGEGFILRVNVAPSLLHNKKFIFTCIRVAKKNNLSLVPELTGQYLFTIDSKTVSTFHLLKESGVQFALDDFGTGYSSLFYLECFTVGSIKVDKMFTQGLERCKQFHYIIETIPELSKKLNIRTITEGVENMELVNKLMLLGVDYSRGYYFGQTIELCSFIREYRKAV